jgi:hypothetical protein
MNYFSHVQRIKSEKKGTIEKIAEEYTELIDASAQGKKIFSVFEACDLICATGAFTFRQFRVPLVFLIVLAYIRKPYKIIRKPFLDYFYGPKKHFFGGEE